MLTAVIESPSKATVSNKHVSSNYFSGLGYDDAFIVTTITCCLFQSFTNVFVENKDYVFTLLVCL